MVRPAGQPAPRVRLEQLVVREFKSIGEQTVRFTGAFNGVVGRNGSGKSNLLDAILFALLAECQRLRVAKWTQLLPVGREKSAVPTAVLTLARDEARHVLAVRLVDGKRVVRLDGRSTSVDGARTWLSRVMGLDAALPLFVLQQGTPAAVLAMRLEETIRAATGSKQFAMHASDARAQMAAWVHRETAVRRWIQGERRALGQAANVSRLEDELRETRVALRAIERKRADRLARLRADVRKAEDAAAELQDAVRGCAPARRKQALAPDSVLASIELHATCLPAWTQALSEMAGSRLHVRLAASRADAVALVEENEADAAAAPLRVWPLDAMAVPPPPPRDIAGTVHPGDCLSCPVLGLVFDGLLVETADDGARLAAAHPRVTFVSRDGTVHRAGSMQGGQPGPNWLAGKLAPRVSAAQAAVRSARAALADFEMDGDQAARGTETEALRVRVGVLQSELRDARAAASLVDGHDGAAVARRRETLADLESKLAVLEAGTRVLADRIEAADGVVDRADEDAFARLGREFERLMHAMLPAKALQLELAGAAVADGVHLSADVTRFSGGEQTLVAVAYLAALTTVSHTRRFILCDEVDAALDGPNRAALERLFAQLQTDGFQLIAVSHHPTSLPVTVTVGA